MSEALDNALGLGSGALANPSFLGACQLLYNETTQAFAVVIGPNSFEFKNAALYINGAQFLSGVGGTFLAQHDPTKDLYLGNIPAVDYVQLAYFQSSDTLFITFVNGMRMELAASGVLKWNGKAIDQASVIAAAVAATNANIQSVAAAQAQTTATAVATATANSIATSTATSVATTVATTVATNVASAAGASAGADAGENAGYGAGATAAEPYVQQAKDWSTGSGLIDGVSKSSRSYALDAAGSVDQVQALLAGTSLDAAGAQKLTFLDVSAGRLLRRSDLKKQLRFPGTGTAVFQVPPNLVLNPGEYDYIDFQPTGGGKIQVVAAAAVNSTLVWGANTAPFKSWSAVAPYPSDGLIGAAQAVDYPTGSYMALVAMGVATADNAASRKLELIVDGTAYPNLIPTAWAGDEANRTPVAFVIPIGDKTVVGSLNLQPKVTSFGGFINLALGLAFYRGVDQAQPYQLFSMTGAAPAGPATAYASSIANPDTSLASLLLMGVVGSDAGTISASAGSIRASGTVGDAATGSAIALVERTQQTAGNIATTLSWTQSRRHTFASLRLLRNNNTVVTVAAPGGRNISSEDNAGLSLLLYPDNKCALRAV